MLRYENGIALPEPKNLCSCGCKEEFNLETGSTFRIWCGMVFYFKLGKYPDPQSHVVRWNDNRVEENFHG